MRGTASATLVSFSDSCMSKVSGIGLGLVVSLILGLRVLIRVGVRPTKAIKLFLKQIALCLKKYVWLSVYVVHNNVLGY